MWLSRGTGGQGSLKGWRRRGGCECSRTMQKWKSYYEVANRSTGTSSHHLSWVQRRWRRPVKQNEKNIYVCIVCIRRRPDLLKGHSTCKYPQYSVHTANSALLHIEIHKVHKIRGGENTITYTNLEGTCRGRDWVWIEHIWPEQDFYAVGGSQRVIAAIFPQSLTLVVFPSFVWLLRAPEREDLLGL